MSICDKVHCQSVDSKLILPPQTHTSICSVISRQTKHIALFELTCPLERNLDKANSFKSGKYAGMQSGLEERGWKVFNVPFEVSSRGQILKHTRINILNTLKQFKIKITAQSKLITSLSKISLLCTFAIFHAYLTKGGGSIRPSSVTNPFQ